MDFQYDWYQYINNWDEFAQGIFIKKPTTKVQVKKGPSFSKFKNMDNKISKPIEK